MVYDQVKNDKTSNGMERAYNYAIYILGLKLRTEGEMREKMRLKKYNAEVIENVINQLVENKYLDDQRYAEVYLGNLKKYKTFGFYGIKKKLMEKRLPPAIIESVLREGLSVTEETKIAKRFTRNYELGIMNYAEKQKLAQKLRAKGFRMDVVTKLIL